jgi:hypothetical protein
MPEKTGEYSTLMSVLFVVIFLCLAIFGAYVILYMTGNAPGVISGGTHHGSFMADISIDGTPPENDTKPQYLRNGSLSGTIHYGIEGDPRDSSCLILAMLDYNQTSVYYDGMGESSHLIEDRVPYSRNVSFSMTGLREGYHDVVFAVIRDAYDDIRDASGFGGMYLDGMCMQYHVITGNATKPNIPYRTGPLEKYVTYRNSTANTMMGYGPWVTKSPCVDIGTTSGNPSGDPVESMTASPGQELDYYINVKNNVVYGTEYTGRFALVQFLDDRQTSLRQDTPVYAYYGALEPYEIMALHGSIKAPMTPGTHMLTIVMAGSPYEDHGRESVEYGYAHVVAISIIVK